MRYRISHPHDDNLMMMTRLVSIPNVRRFCAGNASPAMHLLFVTVGYSASGEVVWGKIHSNSVAAKNADVVFSHFTGNVRENFMTVFEFDSESCVGKDLLYGPHHLDGITSH